MNGWIIFGIVLLILFLLTLIRLGAQVTYGQEGLTVKVRAGKIWITLIPKKPKKPKPEKPAKEKRAERPKQEKPKQETKKEAKPEPDKSKQEKPKQDKSKEEKPADDQPQRKGGLPIPLRELISMAVDAVGMVLSRLQIDTMEMEYLIGGRSDPAAAAIIYGGVYAGGGSMVPLLENTFYSIKKREIRAWIDYNSDQSLIWVQLGLSIRLGQLLSIALRLGIRFLIAFFKQRKENKSSQEGTKNGKQASN